MASSALSAFMAGGSLASAGLALGKKVTDAVNNSASVTKKLGQYDSAINQIARTAQENSAWSAQQAADLRDWQVKQNKIAMDFNAAEAAKNRDWQEYMSNTAHQREIKDLKAAGLNPVLSAMGGNGAAVTSGATASGVTSSGAKGEPDLSFNSALVSLLGSLLNAQTQLANTNTNALANMAVAEKYTAMEKYTAELAGSISRENALLAAETQLTQANISAATSRYVSEVSAGAQMSAAATSALASTTNAAINAAAQKYGHDINSMTQKEINQFNASVNRDLAERGYKHEFDIRTAFPNNAYQAASSIIGQLSGESGITGISSARDALTKDLSGVSVIAPKASKFIPGK